MYSARAQDGPQDMKETKQEPGTAGPGNMLGCCFISFPFLWAILSTSTVEIILQVSNSPFVVILICYYPLSVIFIEYSLFVSKCDWSKWNGEKIVCRFLPSFLSHAHSSSSLFDFDLDRREEGRSSLARWSQGRINFPNEHVLIVWVIVWVNLQVHLGLARQ